MANLMFGTRNLGARQTSCQEAKAFMPSGAPFSSIH